jgi:hypothetical protein
VRVKLDVKSNVAKTMNEYSKLAKTVAKKTYTYFRDITPERTGNAKRRTRLKDTTITADYNYASKLDEGYSRQAPEGMTGPSIDFMEKTFNDEVKKLK